MEERVGVGISGSVSFFLFFFSPSLQLSRVKGNTESRARSPLLDPHTPLEEEVAALDQEILRVRRSVPGHGQDDGMCQALQAGICQICVVPAQTGHRESQ